MTNTVFYTIGISFVSGIFLRSFFNVNNIEIILVLLIGSALLIASRIAAKSKVILLFGLMFIFLALGMARLYTDDTKVSPLETYEGQEISFSGRVAKEPEQRESTTHFYVRPQTEDGELKEHVLVTAEQFEVSKESVSYNDHVLVLGVLEKPEPFASDGGREFDYPGYLKTKGVNYMVRYGELSFYAEGQSSFLSRIYESKSRFMQALEYILPMPHAGLGEGILLGVKRALGKDLEETFRETGIIHIVVLSGYNVMIVVEAMMFFLAYIFLPKLRMAIGLFAIGIFVLLVGPSATVLRASIMASLLLVARATGRTYAIMRALMLAGIIMLVVNPYLLVHDPGFQLSFVATLALILFAPHVERWLRVIPETLGMRTIVTATVATQIFVLPLLLYHTGLLSFVSVIVNALVLPMVPVAMLLTFLTGMFGMFLEPVGVAVGFVTYYSLGYIISISEFFGSFSFAATTVVKFPFWIVVVAYAGLAWILVRLSKEQKTQKVSSETQGDLSDWVIEEENEKTGDSQSESPVDLPFR